MQNLKCSVLKMKKNTIFITIQKLNFIRTSVSKLPINIDNAQLLIIFLELNIG